MKELEEWHLLVSKVSDIQLNHEVDSVNWALERNGNFTTASLYFETIFFLKQNSILV